MVRAAKEAAELPSITDLGRILGAITQREAGIDLAVVGRAPPRDDTEGSERAADDRRRHALDCLLYKQMEALWQIISTMPAKTLSDCAVQIGVAGNLAFKISNNDMEKADLSELADAVERIMVSVMPVLARAAGLDETEFGFNEVTGLHEAWFPQVVA